MGQAQSVPAAAATPRPKKNELKVPSAWKNDGDFLQVSPVSDISNPSQFRGRHTNHTSGAVMTVPASAVRRSRTSKVCPKQQPPTAGGAHHLPPPTRFYFQATAEDEDDNEAVDDKIEARVVSTEVDAVAPKHRSLTATWSAKCAKARQQLGECFQSKEEPMPEPHQVLRYSQRHNVPENRSKAYLQLQEFQPVWKEQSVEHECRNVHRHSKGACVQRLTAASSEDSSPAVGAVVADDNSADRTALAAPTQLPSVTNTTDEEESLPIGRALSLTSKQNYRSSYSTLHSGGTGVSAGLQPTQNTHPNNSNSSKDTDLHRTLSSSSTVGSSTSGVTTVLHQPTNSAAVFRAQVPVATKSSVIAKQAEILRQASSTSTRRRASVERSLKACSSDGNEDDRRRSIEENVQRQIDDAIDQNLHKQQPIVSRVQRLRQKYQEELERMKAQPPPTRALRPAIIVPSHTTSDRYSVPSKKNCAAPVETVVGSVAAKRHAIENRSTSVPGRASDLATYNGKQKTYPIRVSMAASRRSVSAPRSRPSVDGSALLHLSGWNNRIVSSDAHVQPLPVLLSMAGWDKSHQRRSSVGISKDKYARQSVGTTTARSSTGAPKDKYARHSVGSTTARSSMGVPKVAKARHCSAVVPTQAAENTEKPKTTTAVKQPSRGDAPPKDRLSTNSEPAPRCQKMVGMETRKMRKAGSLDLPRREPPIRNGRTIAVMLQQAYFGEEDNESSSSDDGDAKNQQLALVECSPALSVDSVASTKSIPMVSEQALFNAEFLFSADAERTREPRATREEGGGISITTLDSRSRMTAGSGKPVTIPASSSSVSLMEGTASSKEAGRRVRFSEEFLIAKPPTEGIEDIPNIESKLSDLTDTTGSTAPTSSRESTSSSRSSLSIPRIDSIPEEDESPVHLSMLSQEDKDISIFEDDPEETTPHISPEMRWSYCTEGGLTQGVTPLLGGKSASLTTNSPYLRYVDAKDKFSTRKTVASVKRKESPVKRSSPAKRPAGNLVTARIAAMEGRRVLSEGGVTTKVVYPKRARRATTGTNALAPTKSTLTSPLFRKRPADNFVAAEANVHNHTAAEEPPMEGDVTAASPMLVNGQVVSSPSLRSATNITHNLDDSVTSTEDSSESEDVFGAILHPTTIDEDTDDEGCRGQTTDLTTKATVVPAHPDESDSDGDDFDQLLNYEESEDEASIEQPSVSTTIQPGARFSLSSMHTTTTSATEATVVQNRLSPAYGDAMSVVTSSSNGDTASIPNWLQGRPSVASVNENSVISAVSRMKSAFPFREAAPVKPNEQNHRVQPGSVCLSPTQRTPMQARTWRALAAAAHEKDSQRHLVGQPRRGSRSLSNRSPNTLGR